MTIPPTNKTGCFLVQIIDDTELEDTEDFFLELPNPENPLITIGRSQTVIKIEDNDGMQSF